MRIALIGFAVLLPAFAAADDASPAPYVLHQGRAVRNSEASPSGTSQPAAPPVSVGSPANTEAGRSVSAFGIGSIRPGISGNRALARPNSSFSRARGFRGSSHGRSISGTPVTGAPAPAPAPAPADSAPPAYAVPGAKIISEGQQPVYSKAAGGGTHSIEGGGFIAMDQSKAHDVGRAPGITWAPPDTPPSANPVNKGGGGSGASANGPAPAGSGGSTSGSDGSTGGHISGDGNGGNNNQGNNGGQNNSTGFNPAF
jgi:hypothetical protein